MAHVKDEDGPNYVVVTSQSFTAATQRQRLTGTQLPTLPFDLLPEILCRLPVKLLVQLRCLCKFFNSLISDPNFAKKHLRMSTKRHRLMVTAIASHPNEIVQYDSPIPSVFSTSTVFTQTQLYPPNSIALGRISALVLGSCDGIFFGLKAGSFFLWNPSITKYKFLPPLEKPHDGFSCISFGYDSFIDNYKAIIVSFKNKVSVNTLGTDYWTRIEDIPYSDNICGQGVFVNGSVNWLASHNSSIFTLDLEKESYQELLLPDSENHSWTKLGVVRDCLCVFARGDMFLDVWIMKEYGKKDSWTKLYSVPNMQDQGFKAYTVSYISEDDQLLLCDMRGGNRKFIVYDSKTGTFNIPEFQNNYKRIDSNVYIESLISP